MATLSTTPVYLTDLANLKVGSTQLVGASSAVFNPTYNRIRRTTDGIGGLASAVNTNFAITCSLRCNGVSQIETILDATTNTSSVAISAIGKLPAGTKTKVSMNNGVLTRLAVNAQTNQYANLDMDFVNRAADASVLTDEFAITTSSSDTIAAPSAKAAYRLKSCTFGSATDPINCMTSFSLNCQANVITRSWGTALGTNTIIIPNWSITGSITFPDFQVASSMFASSFLQEQARGSLVVVFKNEGGYDASASDSTMTVLNCQFYAPSNTFTGSEGDNLASTTIQFEGLFVDSSNAIKTFDQMIEIS